MSLTAAQIAAINRSQKQANDDAIRKQAREIPLAVVKSPRSAKRMPSDWRHALAQRSGRIIGDERNVLQALRLAPEFIDLVRFNSFALQVEFTRSPPWRAVKPGEPWTDDDDVAAQALLQELGVDVRARHVIADTVPLIAREHSYEPVRDYLRSLHWDGEHRIEHWLTEYLGSDEPTRYAAAVGKRFLISAVARAMQDGCQVDHVLVFEGGQGLGKSTAARTLAVKREWFTDEVPDLSSKDAALQLCGRWIIELGELAAIRQTREIESTKAFLTRTCDVYRPPYGRRTISVPRRSVFIATTNESEYLRDRTGNRRYWPVRCRKIDLDRLTRDRDQLWAEAALHFHAGEQWHLTVDETVLAAEAQHERMLVTELELSVAEFLARLADQGINEIDTRRVIIAACGLDPDSGDFVERAGRLGPAVAAAMLRSGWSKVRTSGRGALRRNIYGAPHRGSQG